MHINSINHRGNGYFMGKLGNQTPKVLLRQLSLENGIPVSPPALLSMARNATWSWQDGKAKPNNLVTSSGHLQKRGKTCKATALDPSGGS